MPGTVLSGICISINLVPTTALRGGYCYYPSATYKLKRGYYSQFVLSLYCFPLSTLFCKIPWGRAFYFSGFEMVPPYVREFPVIEGIEEPLG